MARILLIEEDAARRERLAARLTQAGYTLDGFAGADAALLALRDDPPPDLMLLDWWMPARWELLLERERDPRLANVRVVGIQRPSELDAIVAAVAQALVTPEPAPPPPRANPFGGLAARLGALAAKLPVGTGHAQLDTAVAQARAGAERADAIARYVQTYARPRGDEPARIDLRRTLQRSIDLALPEIRPHAQLVLQLADVPPVIAREHELGHACFHLLINAAQALADGTPEVDRIEVLTGTAGDGWAFVEIRDSGPGIPSDVMPHVFEPFFSTRGGRGMGLGLYLCHCTVAEHGGQLSVESLTGHGASFRLALPPAGRA
jgi:signal transduction histidine kinase